MSYQFLQTQQMSDGHEYALLLDSESGTVIRTRILTLNSTVEHAVGMQVKPAPYITPTDYTSLVHDKLFSPVSHAKPVNPIPTFHGYPIDAPEPPLPAPAPPSAPQGEMPRANPMIPPHFQVNKMFVDGTAGFDGGDTELRRV